MTTKHSRTDDQLIAELRILVGKLLFDARQVDSTLVKQIEEIDALLKGAD